MCTLCCLPPVAAAATELNLRCFRKRWFEGASERGCGLVTCLQRLRYSLQLLQCERALLLIFSGDTGNYCGTVAKIGEEEEEELSLFVYLSSNFDLSQH